MKYLFFVFILIISPNIAFAEDLVITPDRLPLKEAIEAMLSSNPSIEIYRKNVEISKARSQQAHGDFDFVLSTFITEERDWPDKNSSQLTYNQITSGMQISKKTKWGSELSGGIKATYTELYDKKTDNPNVYFNLSVPLARSWKKTINAADEISSKIEYQAAKLDMLDAVSLDIMDLVIDYWHYVAAYERLQIAIKTEKRSETLVNEIKESRKSRQAYMERKNSAKIRMLAAREKMKPNLDLNLGINVSKYQEGFELTEKFGPFYSGTISLSYEWPIGNNKAAGNYARNLADYNKTLLEIALLDKKIRSNIIIKLSKLAKIVEKYKERDKSVKLYNITLKNEKKKFRLGMSTTIDVISTEQSYLYALLDRINDRLEYAVTLSELEYETGVIEITGDNVSRIDTKIFFNLPYEISLKE